MYAIIIETAVSFKTNFKIKTFNFEAIIHKYNKEN